MDKYKVIQPVDHDGKRFEIDSTIELGAEHADPLLMVGAIAVIEHEKKQENAKAK